MSGSVILGYLATRDVAMVQRWPTLCRMSIIPLLYYAWAWVATGLTNGILFWCLCVFPLLLYLFWLLAAVISVRRTSHAGAPSQVATGKKPGRQGQRVVSRSPLCGVEEHRRRRAVLDLQTVGHVHNGDFAHLVRLWKVEEEVVSAERPKVHAT